MADDQRPFTAYWIRREPDQKITVFAYTLMASDYSSAYRKVTRYSARRPGLTDDAIYVGVVEGNVPIAYMPGEPITPVDFDAANK